MPTTRKSGKPEMLSRDVEIKASSLTVRIRAVHAKGDEPEIESQPWLQLKGVLTEPVKGVRDVVISSIRRTSSKSARHGQHRVERLFGRDQSSSSSSRGR